MASLSSAPPPHPSVTFPRLLLASVDDSGPSFAGWVGSDASGEDLWLRLEPQTCSEAADGGEEGARRRPPPSDDNPLRASQLLLSPALQRALRGHEDAVAARLRQSRDAPEFFCELKTLLEAVGVVASSSGSGRSKKRSRGGDDDTGGGSGRSLSSSSSPFLSSAFYSALLERLGPGAWISMTAMREVSSAAAGSDSRGEVLLSFAVPRDQERASSPSPSSPPLRVTLALDPSTFPRSCPRVASVDLPGALLRPPLSLPIATWWNKAGGGSDNDKNKAEETKKSSSTVDDVLSWLLAAASSRAAAACFAALDQLDSQAWVLDPPLPAPRSRTSRRLAAAGGGRASVEVDFASFFDFSPSSSVSFLPAPRLSGWLGPEALVVPLREAAEASSSSRGGFCSSWDPRKGAVENLEALLLLNGEGEGQRLPRKPGGASAAAATGEKEGRGKEEGEPPVGLGDGAECAICCAYRLDGDGEGYGDGDGGGGGGEGERGAGAKNPASSSSLPGVSCENEKCGRPFHASCLRQWLIAAAGGGGGGGGGREGAGAGGGGGGVLRGECPYCSEPISVSKE